MANRALRFFFLACGIVCLTAIMGSQAQSDEAIPSSLPVVQMNVQFRLVPQYFVQRIDDDPKYSRIEALIDNDPSRPWYEIILADMTTGDRIYSNSAETVNTLQHVGKTAFRCLIQFAVSTQPDSIPTFILDPTTTPGSRSFGSLP
jgi:hypothetical protein